MELDSIKDEGILEKIGLKTYNFDSEEDCRLAINDDDPEVRIKAIESLASLKNQINISPVSDLIKRESNLKVKATAIKALGQIGKKESFEILLWALLEGTPQLMEDIVFSLSKIGEPRAIYYIKKAINEIESPELKQSIKNILSQIEENSSKDFSSESNLNSNSIEEERNYIELLLGSLEDGEDERPLLFLKDALIKKDSESIKQLQSLLNHQDEKTRLKAVTALSHVPFDDDIKNSLLEALKDKNDVIRLEALHILLKSKDPQLSPKLFMFLNDANPIFYQEVSKFLMENPNQQVMQMASDALESPDIILRARAASYLAKTDKETNMPLLIELLQDTRQPIEVVIELIVSLKPKRAQYIGRALHSLLKKGEKQVLMQLASYFRKVNNPNLYGVLGKNMVSGDPRIRHGAAFLVGQTGDNRYTGNLISLLQDPYDLIKVQAGWSLAHLGEVPAFPQILSVYNESKDLKIRKSFLEIMSRLDINQALPILLHALSNDKPEIKYHSAQLLGLYSGNEKEQIITALQNALSDIDSRVVFMCINSLINLGASEFNKPMNELLAILKVYLSDKRQTSDFRAQAAKNILYILQDKKLDILIEILKNVDDDKVLSVIIEALGKIDDPVAFKTLTELLASNKPQISKKAAHTLCMKEDTRAVPYLLQFLENSHVTYDTKFLVTTFIVTDFLDSVLKEPINEDIEHSLMQLLKHKSLPIALMACFHLAYGGSNRIRESFFNLLKSPFVSLRYIAALGLGRLGDINASQSLIEIAEDREFEKIKNLKEKNETKYQLYKYYNMLSRFSEIESNVTDASISKKILAITFLGKLKQANALETLKNLTKNKEQRVVEATVKALALSDDSSIIPVLLDLKENGTDVIIESHIDSILYNKQEETARFLTAYLSSPSQNKRTFAAKQISSIGESKISSEFIKPLKDDFWLVRYWAITGIAKLKLNNEELYEPLTICLKDKSPIIRAGALNALSSFENFEDYYQDSYKDPHYFVRAEALKIAGALKIKKAESILLESLSDENSTVRASAIRALGELESKSSIPAIIKQRDTNQGQEKIWSLYSLYLLSKKQEFISELIFYTATINDDHPEEILTFKLGKSTPIKYYPGVFKKLAELGFSESPLIFRDEFIETKKGQTEFLAIHIKNLDKIYVEKPSIQKENQFQAIIALSLLSGPGIIKSIGEILKKEREKDFKIFVLNQLASLSKKEAFIAMIPALFDPQTEIYIKAAHMLKKEKSALVRSNISLIFKEMEKELEAKQKNNIIEILGWVP